MLRDINLVFHRQGLRSFIEVDLCAQCPRQDNKGCCGFYSPVFYLTDLYFLNQRRPDLIDYIARLPRLTVLDASITVDSIPDGEGFFRCQFHSIDQGCLLSMDLRESVCRHFVCPGIAWEEEDKLAPWKEYFDQLADHEIQLNNTLALRLRQTGLTLRNPEDWEAVFSLLDAMMSDFLEPADELGSHLPRRESATIRRPIRWGAGWPL